MELFRRDTFRDKKARAEIEGQSRAVFGFQLRRRDTSDGLRISHRFEASIGSLFAGEGPHVLTFELLVRAIAQHPDSEFRAQLKTMFLTRKGMERALGPHGSPGPVGSARRPKHDPAERQVGDALVIKREADHFALDVDLYAEAVAKVFSQAEGEFCFAIYGAWGRGKTVLSQRLEKVLNHRSGALPAYEVVRFSAWKYKRTPEAWFYLYETLAQSFKAVDPFTRICRTIRERVARLGHRRVTSALGLGLLATLPLSAYVTVVAAALPVIGIAGLLYLGVVLLRAFPRVDVLARWYGRLADHRVHLGVQAAIGDDLRALLIGWVPRARITSSARPVVELQLVSVGATRIVPAVTLALVATTWWVIFFDPLGFRPAIAASCSSDLEVVTNFCRYLASPLSAASAQIGLVILLVWSILCALYLCAAFFPKSSPDRVLLIIDDLDRCNPLEAVEIVEAMKLLLEEEDIASRLQVLVLADEEVLSHAISEKFRTLIDEKAATSNTNRADIARHVVREHLEKIFACHLRLGSLSQQNVSELMDAFLSPYAQSTAGSSVADGGRQNSLKGQAEQLERRRAKPDNDAPSEKAVVQLEPTHFSSAEVNALRRRFARLETSFDISPRMLRSLLFKYQLCRLLLQAKGAPAKPDQILDELVRQAMKNQLVKPHSLLEMLVSQVR